MARDCARPAPNLRFAADDRCRVNRLARLDQVLFWTARDLERNLADFQTYYNAARSHASLAGDTPSTFASGRPMVAHLTWTMCGGFPIVGTWSNSQWRLDNEFEVDSQ
jgi:hypothetical protein